MKTNLNKFLIIFIFIPFLFITTIYASFSSDLLINGTAMLRISSDIRVSNLKVVEQKNGAYEKYSSEYNKDSTSIYATLPNLDSTITYEVTIKNNSSIDYDLNKLIIETDSNSNITYTIDATIGDIIENNSEKIYTIKLFYSDTILSEDLTDSLIIKYEFVEHINSYVVATYDYTGTSQTFNVPYNGIYKIELWGAQGGGDTTYTGGFGAYTSGLITLHENDNLYVYVGEYGINENEVFNNGGTTDYTIYHTDEGYGYAGGGSTDIRTVSGTWSDFESRKSRIMVAAGGGGTQTYYSIHLGGAAGGLIGYDGEKNEGEFGNTPTGATQTIGGNNGMGTHVITGPTNGFGIVYLDILKWVAKGGNGYYAGGNGPHGDGTVGSGAGGSSFISGHKGCDAILESSTEDNIIHTGQSIHYSKYQFTNTIMIDGKGYEWTTTKGEYTGMPSHDGLNKIIGNEKNGYAKITFIERIFS